MQREHEEPCTCRVKHFLVTFWSCPKSPSPEMKWLRAALQWAVGQITSKGQEKGADRGDKSQTCRQVDAKTSACKEPRLQQSQLLPNI